MWEAWGGGRICCERRSWRPSASFWVLRGLACAFALVLVGIKAGEAVPSAIRIATYNIENYILEPEPTRPAKSLLARSKVQEMLLEMRADVVALEEIGPLAALDELRESLAVNGLRYPYWEHVAGHDTNIHVAVLSRFAFQARRSITNANYLLNGRRMFVSRGFAELDIEPHPGYRFTLIAAHLKSKRMATFADEAELRQHEALMLRERVDAVLRSNPKVNLIVLGDFNDTPNSLPIRTLLGRGASSLVDTRPVESDGRNNNAAARVSSVDSRTVAWTHYFAREDSYQRLDYILLSSGAAREWERLRSFVLAYPGWGIASDHRPVVVTIVPRDR